MMRPPYYTYYNNVQEYDPDLLRFSIVYCAVLLVLGALILRYWPGKK